MISLVLVRHCESIGNIALQKSFFQQDDSMYTDEFMSTPSTEWALSEYGRSHAVAIGVYLGERIVPNKVFVSNTRRTMETVEWMGVPPEEVISTSLLRERDYAGLELKPKNEWLRCVADLNKAMQSLSWKPPGGESMNDVVPRVENFLKTNVLENQTTLIVTHGDIIQVMRMALLGLSGSSRQAFREMRGNYIRTGQIFFYEEARSGVYRETTVHYDGTTWHNLSIDFKGLL